MIYIESKSRDPHFNLALEEYVFEKFDKTQEYFMLWQNSNTIVIGKYQNAYEEINRDFVEEKNITVARRLTGGGAVYHDDGNLNFTYIVNQKNSGNLDFKSFLEPVINAIKNIGAEAEFTGRNDLVINGRKISGSSQFAKKGRILNHGCIMLDSNLENVSGALKPKPAKFKSKNTRSVRSRVTTINDNLKRQISMEEFKTVIMNEIRKNDQIHEYELTEKDKKNIEHIRNEKYATWEWVYGKAKKYEYRYECKYDFGIVSVDMDVDQGIIIDIKVHGDFFGNRDIKELEEALIGERLDNKLDKRLEDKIRLDDYISGMTPRALKLMLM